MLRLTSFAARGFRSLAEVELADLPRVVLLYGENNVGKSNLIQAVDLWFRLLRAAAGVWPLPLPGHEPEMRLCEEARLELEALERPELLFGQEPGRLPRDGQSSFELEGTLRVAEEHDFVFGFRTSVIAGEPWPRVELLRALAPGPARIGSPLASTDLRLLGLRQELAHGWLRLEAARRFWPERLAQQRENGEAALAGDGSNVKRQLFSAAHGVQTAPRRLVEESFVPLVRRALPGLAPPLSLHDEEFVHLYLGERRVEDCGSGVQQWVLLTALLALSRAAVIGIEEPEDHLSWSMQKTVAEALAAVIHDPGRPPYQLIASTHSELMEGMSLDGSWYRVTLEQGATRVERCRDRQALAARYARPDVQRAMTPMRLLSANMIELHEEVVRHLQAEPGEVIGWSLEEEAGEPNVRLFGEKSLNEWPSEEEFDEEEPGEEAAEHSSQDGGSWRL